MTRDLSCLLSLVLSEVGERLSSKDGADFLRTVGRKLASTVPLHEATTLEALSQLMSETLNVQGLGTVVLSLDRKGLVLAHSLSQSGPFSVNGGNHLAALILEGAYHGWLDALTDNRALTLKLLSCTETHLIYRLD